MQNFFSRTTSSTAYRTALASRQSLNDTMSPSVLKTSTKSKRKTCFVDKENLTSNTKSTTSSIQNKVKRLCLGNVSNTAPINTTNTSVELTNSFLSFTKSLDLCLDQDSHDSGFSNSQNSHTPLADLDESIEMESADMDQLNTYCLENSAHTNRILIAADHDDSFTSTSARRCLFEDSPVTRRPSTPVSVLSKTSTELFVEESSSTFSSFVEQSLNSIQQMLENTTTTTSASIQIQHDQIKESLDIECQSITQTFHSEVSTSTSRLIGDRSKYHILPTKTSVKHNDLSVISTETLSRVLNNEFSSEIDNFLIIDSRYPYEYEGGHIQNAHNLYTKEQIYEKFIESDELKKATEKANSVGKRLVLIFHCEFSSERGPSMLRFLRNQDRTVNKDSYPKLFYPELYLLEGGYKAFYERESERCEPKMYKPMLHEDHVHDLKHFRAKTKTWNRQGSNSCMSAFKNPLLAKSRLQRFPRSTLF